MLKNKVTLELHTKFHPESAYLTFTYVKELIRPAASDTPWLVVGNTSADKHSGRRTDDMVSDVK